MSNAPPILVLTSCTATKALDSPNGPLRAESLYAGQQHVRLMRGVRAYRRASQPAGPLRVRIVSAAHGLVSASTRISPYEASFRGLARDGIRTLAKELELPVKVRALLRQRWALVVMLLGDSYLAAIDLDEEVELGGPTVALCGPRVALGLPDHPRLHTLTLGTPQASRFGCPLVALKGELAGRMLVELAQRPKRLKRLQRGSLGWLDWLDELATTTEHGRVPAATKKVTA